MLTRKIQQKIATVAFGFAVLVSSSALAQSIDAENVNITSLTQALEAAKGTQTAEEIAKMLANFYAANPAAFNMYLTTIIETVSEAAPALMTELKTSLGTQEQTQVFTQIVSTLQNSDEPEVQQIAQTVITENTDIVAAIQQQVVNVQPAAGPEEEEPEVTEEEVTEEEAQQSTN